MSRLLPYVDPYPAAVFHMRKYVPANMDGRGHIVPPAIDRLAPKNMAFSPEDAVYVCEQFGIGVDRPQVLGGETVILVSSDEECAQRSLEIVQDPGLGKRLGRAGKEAVRRQFLLPRLLRDWLELFEQLEA